MRIVSIKREIPCAKPNEKEIELEKERKEKGRKQSSWEIMKKGFSYTVA